MLATANGRKKVLHGASPNGQRSLEEGTAERAPRAEGTREHRVALRNTFQCLGEGFGFGVTTPFRMPLLAGQQATTGESAR